jgi:hypothetical protein
MGNGKFKGSLRGGVCCHRSVLDACIEVIATTQMEEVNRLNVAGRRLGQSTRVELKDEMTTDVERPTVAGSEPLGELVQMCGACNGKGGL